MFVLLARANLAATLAATFKTAQYHLSLAAMLFRNIRNPAFQSCSSTSSKFPTDEPDN